MLITQENLYKNNFNQNLSDAVKEKILEAAKEFEEIQPRFYDKYQDLDKNAQTYLERQFFNEITLHSENTKEPIHKDTYRNLINKALDKTITMNDSLIKKHNKLIHATSLEHVKDQEKEL